MSMAGGHPLDAGPHEPVPPGRQDRRRDGGSDRGRRSISRSPDRRRGSPPRRRGGRSRSYSPPRGRPRRRSRTRSRSRSRSPRGRRDYRDRDFDRGPPHRDRFGGPPPPRGGYGPPYRDDDRWGGGPHLGRHRDYGPPPPPPHHGGAYGPFDHGPPPGGRRSEGRGRRDEGPPGVSLLVRNIAPDITTQDLQGSFGRIGIVRDVYIPRDFYSQKPRGFAFIEYATPEMAREAKIEMNRFVIKGHALEVVFAQERRKTPNEMRGRGDGPDEEEDPREGDRRGGFERSSSFERHQQREREVRRRDPEPRPRGDLDRSGGGKGEELDD